MVVHFKPRIRPTVHIPLTPIIDIVFLLLIYFLLTTNFMVEEGIKVTLPQAKATAPQNQEEITVYIDKAEKIFLGKEEVSLSTLFRQLREMLRDNQEKLIVIKADQEVTIDKAVKVMDVAKTAGAGKLVLSTEKPFESKKQPL